MIELIIFHRMNSVNWTRVNDADLKWIGKIIDIPWLSGNVLTKDMVLVLPTLLIFPV